MVMDSDGAMVLCRRVQHWRRDRPDEFFGVGRAAEVDIDCRDVDMQQLRAGIEVEMEHVAGDKRLESQRMNEMATKIALDHLAEFPDYYTALYEMERTLEKKHGGQ